MVLTDELCDRLCAAAREKSLELGVAAAASEGGSLMAVQSNDPRITLVAGGRPD